MTHDCAGLQFARGTEPAGSDHDLISELERMALEADTRGSAAADDTAEAEDDGVARGELVEQVLERPLRIGEVSLDELERAFREAEVEVELPVSAALTEIEADAEMEAEAAPPAPLAPRAPAPAPPQPRAFSM